MAYRLLDQLPQYRAANGSVLAFGSLNFYVTGTSTPKAVFAEPALSTNLGAVIELDADGRHSEDLWLAEDAEYRVVLEDEDGDPVWTREHVRNTIGAGISPPNPTDGTDGQALLTDGTAWYFQTLREVPDPTGYSNGVLRTDGSLVYWEEEAEAEGPTGEVDDDPTTGFDWNDGILEVWGTGTCPTNGSGLSSTVGITFSHAFDSSPFHVSITPVLSSGITTNTPSGFPNVRYSSLSASGCTVGIFVGQENEGGTNTINATCPFTYWAKGPCAVNPGA